MLLLDLNDICVSLSRSSGPIYRAAGYALNADDSLVYGAAAIGGYRLQPQQSNNLYLDKLSAEPLSRTLAGASNYADLLYQQFSEIAVQAADEPVTMVTPPTVTPDQLSLILGVANEAGLRVQRFVDSAVLAAATAQLPASVSSQLFVLDLSLHHLLLTELAVADTVTRSDASALPGAGLHQLLEGWLNVAADRFIQSTRYDPLHQAASEQQVFSQLAAWAGLDQLDPMTQLGADLTIAVTTEGDVRSLSVSANALSAKASQRLAQSFERLPEQGHCLLMPRVSMTPTLYETLAAARPGLTLHAMAGGPGSYLPTLFAAHPELFATSSEVQLVQSLPRRPTSATSSAQTTDPAQPIAQTAQPAPPLVPADTLPTASQIEQQREPSALEQALRAAADRPAPTHLVRDGVAVPIDRSLFEWGLPLARTDSGYIVMPSEEPLRYGSTDLATGTRIPTGVVFNWQGAELQLVAIRER